MVDEQINRLKGDVKRFLEVYRFLSAEGKGQFESQMRDNLNAVDQRTRKLYLALLQAAQRGATIEDAIVAMDKAGN